MKQHEQINEVFKDRCETAQKILLLPSLLKQNEISMMLKKNERLIIENQLKEHEHTVLSDVIRQSVNDPSLSSEAKRATKVKSRLDMSDEYKELKRKHDAVEKDIQALWVEFNYNDRTFKALRTYAQLIGGN